MDTEKPEFTLVEREKHRMRCFSAKNRICQFRPRDEGKKEGKDKEQITSGRRQKEGTRVALG